MSAFICNPETFSNVYSGLRIYGMSNLHHYSTIKQAMTPFLGIRTLDECIAKLYELNVEAVNQRYGDKTKLVPDDDYLKSFKNLDPHISMFQFLKSLECLSYQMSEGDIPETPEYQALENLIKAVSYSIAHSHPDYESASWN